MTPNTTRRPEASETHRQAMTPTRPKTAHNALQVTVRAVFWATVTVAGVLTVSFAGFGNH